MQYYMVVNGESRGPLEKGDLLRNGLRPDTLVWRDGMPQWLAAGAVAELRDILPAAPPPIAPPPGFVHPSAYHPAPAGYYPPPPADNKKLAAGLCAILVGALGVHKFILGYNKAGTIMLLVSLLTCGLGAPVMHIIAVVEGIIYLTKSDAEFYQEYVVNRKEWF